MEFQSRFLPIPQQSFFLFGPRGTGKSTWLKCQFPDALFVDLLQPDIYRTMSARPERLRELVRGSPQRTTVVVDEVQQVPDPLNTEHLVIDGIWCVPGEEFLCQLHPARGLTDWLQGYG
jgi:predicted AAA+ superfamily ATPase